MHFTRLAPLFWPKFPKFICILIVVCIDSGHYSVLGPIYRYMELLEHLDVIRSIEEHSGIGINFLRAATHLLRAADS